MQFSICAPWLVKTAELNLYLKDRNQNSLDDNKKDDTPVIDFRLPFTEINGRKLPKNFLKKLRYCLKIKIKYKAVCNTRFIVSIKM